ncbi:acetolactate synthase-1/2/3 large subunit [Citreimonas salinaria]|uniref:Acetolactate synthase-1/2/3 large subunit n=2 Tax=Citreimonas salinaria TaxID=321339 RepID=A0A1H3NGJ4_9RHOB|nr:acetolactate synthase-1/2/3 large subunit [Citreimonas salinaria]
MRGADLLVELLARNGVRRIYSLSGNQIMPIYDACIDADIEIVHTRHEAAAVFMAESWAQLTGEIGVALVTAAPGFGNAVGPLFSARSSESPVLLISGDAPNGLDGRGAFQELDQTSISTTLVKAAFRPVTLENLARDTLQAISIATTGRPGPVHLAIPFDVVQQRGDMALPEGSPPSSFEPRAQDVAAILKGLATAARPLILTGPALNSTRAGGLLDALAEAFTVPVLDLESPRGLKDPSIGTVSRLLPEADLVLCLGKTVDFTLAFGAAPDWSSDCSWVVVDAEEHARELAARNLGTRLAQSVAASPRSLIRALLEAPAPEPRRADWRVRIVAAAAKRPHEVPAGKEITSATLCTAVQRQVEATETSVVICDGGEFGQWAQALVRGDARVINGPSGAIGGALCYALAAKQARPEASVVALMGDGTVGFHFAEFETAARTGVAFVVVIGNDERWNAEHLIQIREYGPDRTVGCTLSGARYDLAAEALGCHGAYVTDPDELDDALAQAFQSGRPACVNVAIKGLPAPAGEGH